MYLMSKSRIFLLHNLFSTIILGNFLEMIMLIRSIDTLTQTRMWIGRVTFTNPSENCDTGTVHIL